MQTKRFKFLILLGIIATAHAGPAIIQSNRMEKMQDAAKDFGDSWEDGRQEKEAERRQVRRDSMDRVNDSLEAEIKRLEARRKKQQLEREYWEYLRDSVNAARAMESQRVRKAKKIADEEAAEKAGGTK